MDKAKELFDCARLILRDGCPPDPKMHLCRYDPDMACGLDCTRCWDAYLFFVFNWKTEIPRDYLFNSEYKD